MLALGTPEPPFDSCSVVTAMPAFNGCGFHHGNTSGASPGMCNITLEQTPAQAFLQSGGNPHHPITQILSRVLPLTKRDFVAEGGV